MERKKRVLLGISGGISAYKACEIVSSLTKSDVEVKVIMTENACKFVAPKTFEVLSKNRVSLDTFQTGDEKVVEHIALANWCDVFLVAPATANTIAKFALGIADDMLSTTYIASKAHKIIVPAMNTNMYESDGCTQNLQTLRDRGVEICEPVVGNLACGDSGKGKMKEAREIVEEVLSHLENSQKMLGKRVIVTAGGTSEAIDRVRFVTNNSSGKMGVEIAKAFARMGAEVVFVQGNVSVEVPKFFKNIKVVSTGDMYRVCMEELEQADAVVKAAAPCDFKIKEEYSGKIKAKTLSLEFVPNVDIAMEIGKQKGKRVLAIFSAETENLLENAREKLKRKNADFVVANDVTMEGAGFFVDTNIATLIFADGRELPQEKMKKSQLAEVIAQNVALLCEKVENK